MLSFRSSTHLRRIPLPRSVSSSSNINALASSSASSSLVASSSRCRRASSFPSSSRAFSSSFSSLAEDNSSSSPLSNRPGAWSSSSPPARRSALSWRSVPSDSSSSPSFPDNDQPSSSLAVPRYPAQDQPSSSPELRRPAFTEVEGRRTSHQLPHLFPNTPQRKTWGALPRSSTRQPLEPAAGSWRNSAQGIVRPSFTPQAAPEVQTWGGGLKRAPPSQTRNGDGAGWAARAPGWQDRLPSRRSAEEPASGGFGIDAVARPDAPAINTLPAGFTPLSPPARKLEARKEERKQDLRQDRISEQQYKRPSTPLRPSRDQSEAAAPRTARPDVMRTRVKKEVFIPNAISVERLAVTMGVRIRRLQMMMTRAGLQYTDATHMLSAEDASIVAEDMGYSATVDAEKSFDLYPAPIPADMSAFPLRPPIVTIMGHVDHGKTTLLDTLRKASVAKGEAGGITQHIGAFSVAIPPTDPNSTQPRTICFLDTPGHAAFSAMRARGAQVTDIIILVVAADDGVMPQTKEVIRLVEETPNVQLVVAINKVDKHKANVEAIKAGLGAAGVMLEEIGGEVPAVEVSGLTGKGLDTLMETVSTLAEVAELRAEVDMPAEGYVLESQIENGRGITATCLIVRGTLKPGAHIIAGTAVCKVRTLTDDKGKAVKSVLPGFPVVVTGWSTVPSAGDEILQAANLAEQQNALKNRNRQLDMKKETENIELQNEKRRIATEAHEEEQRIEREARAARRQAYLMGEKQPPREFKPTPKAVMGHIEGGPKTLKLFVKGDVSGSVEAVVETLKSIGNDIAKVVVIGSAVGDISKGDVAFAETAGATIVGFSVKVDRQTAAAAAVAKVPILLENVIYRLVEQVVTRTEDLLPPIIDVQVNGEATIQEIFEIKPGGGKAMLKVAGCRVHNGAINKKDWIRVMRGTEEVFRGTLDTLKRLKDEVTSVGKGLECGMNLHGFTDLREGDAIQSITIIESRRKL